MKLKGMTPADRQLDQIERWAQGESIHNEEDNQCCPDFSCCNPDMKTPPEERDQFLRLFKSGGMENCMAQLGEFLGRAIAIRYPDKKVSIITPVDGQN